MDTRITFNLKFETSDIRRARNWGDPILVEQAGLSAELVGSNFNPLPLYCFNTKTGEWSGTWSAVANSLKIPRADLDKLIAMQPKESDPTLNQRMNWLIYNGFAERPMWTKGQGSWDTTPEAYYGTIVFGDNYVKIDDEKTFTTKLPNESSARPVKMNRLVCFRKSDWGVTNETHPWLIHRGTEVDNNDVLNVYPKGGTIWSPLWSPLDWDFAGAFQPDSFWIPSDWIY